MAPVRPPELSIADLNVQVRIESGVAAVRIDQTVVNGTQEPVHTRNLWPAPPGMEVNHFRYSIGDRVTIAERTEGEAADQVYRTAAEKSDDPRVLRYLGRPFFRGPDMQIPALGRLSMRMEYRAVLPVEQGVTRFQHPLSTNGFSALPINQSKLRISVKDRSPVTFHYSPTHAFDWADRTDGTVEGVVSETNRRIETDLLFYYGTGAGPVDFRVLAHRSTGFGGVFLASVRPGPVAMSRQTYAPRDVVFVLDRSGSMAGEKLRQAVAGLEFSLSRLNPKDRFTVLWYDHQVELWRPELQPASESNVQSARQALRELKPAGGTNIQGALLRALGLLRRGERPGTVIFLTDGLPTAGVTEPGAIRASVRQANSRGVRLFTFGVGYDVNVPLLDTLSSQNRGDAEYVRPGDNLEARMASFYEKQAQPLLTDLQLAIDGADAVELLPGELPDLFVKGEVLVVGRYRRPGKAVARLSGNDGTRRQVYDLPVELPATAAAFDFLPRLWGQRRVGELLDEVRLKGHQPELLRQISSLSREFGILTDYTQSLVDDRVSLNLSEQATALGVNVTRANGVYQGAFATSQSVNNRGLRQQGQVYQNRYLDETGREVESGQVRQAGQRSQFYRGGYWTDPEWPAEQQAIRIRRFSPAYWELLRHKPALSDTLAAGKRVRFLLSGVPVQIDDAGISELDPATRGRLFGEVALLPPGTGGAHWALLAAFFAGGGIVVGVTEGLRRLGRDRG